FIARLVVNIDQDRAFQSLREITQIALDLGELGLVEILACCLELCVAGIQCFVLAAQLRETLYRDVIGIRTDGTLRQLFTGQVAIVPFDKGSAQLLLHSRSGPGTVSGRAHSLAAPRSPPHWRSRE